MKCKILKCKSFLRLQVIEYKLLIFVYTLEHGNINKQIKNSQYFSSWTSMGMRKSSNHFPTAVKSPYLTSSKAVIQNLNGSSTSNNGGGGKPLISTTP